MALIETTIIIPVADNAGVVFDEDDWIELQRRIGQVAPGMTRRGPHAGLWTDDGVTYTEPVYEFEVDIESWFAIPGLLDVVRWTQQHFRQLGIMFKVAGIPEVYQP